MLARQRADVRPDGRQRDPAAGTALPKDSILELWVYKANDKGYPGANGSDAMDLRDQLREVQVGATAKDQFRYFSGTWTSSTVNACANNTP